MAGINKSPVDTLLTGAKKLQVGTESTVYDLVGKRLGSFLLDVVKNKEIKSELPLGFKSTIKPGDYSSDFEGRSLTLRKNIYKNLDAKLKVGRNKLMLEFILGIK